MGSGKLTYTNSGVNIKKADKFVKHISNISKKTNKSGDFKNIGGFGAISNVPKYLKNPHIVTSTDGVGTKIEIANELNKFDTNEESLVCPTTSTMIYPSIAPCVLAMVTRGDEILLARNNLFPEGLYSVLAGFVEVSESAEETVKREVLEESGLEVDIIQTQQQFPFKYPKQIPSPFTILIEDINDNKIGKHQHIDLIYFCMLTPGQGVSVELNPGWIWVTKEQKQQF